MRSLLFCRTQGFMLTLVAAACVAATVVGERSSGVGGPMFVLDLALGVLGCCLVPLMPRWPVAVALVLAAFAAVAPTATPPATIGVLQVAGRRPLPVAIGVALVGTAAHAVRDVWRPQAGLSYSWWLLLVVVAHAALVGFGALTQARAALIASLYERARRAEAEQGRRIAEARAAERTLIAREMHDVLAHRLSLLATYAGALEYRPDMAPEQFSRGAGVIRATVHDALNELRDVIALLREETPTDGVERPVPALADLPALVEESRAVGTPIELRDALTNPTALPGPAGRTAYRVVQEALTNARKHAPGQPVSIALDGTPGKRLVIDVCNPLNGAGGSSIPGAGTGLVGLTERVRLAGGQLDHQAVSGEFRLHAWLPWPA
ncbi:MAG TPA: histidine kinase [Pseudonocardiaceae bacterium]|nr:histidine kinase [Pseudonocardiaceae bacterium]